MFGGLARFIKAAAGAMVVTFSCAPAVVKAADLESTRLAPGSEIHPPAFTRWKIRLTPYGWMTSLKGDQSIRGRNSHIDASFIDIVKGSDTLLALMGGVEARKGPWSIYSDLVWTRIGVGDEAVRVRSLAPGVTATIGEALRLNIEMTILEAGVTYELTRSGPFRFDVYGGARYWRQKGDLSYDSSIATDIGELERVGSRAVARSGSVQWLDPLAGARIRYALATGQELFLRGDLGGFGLGSTFSWQALGGYGFHVGSHKGLLFSGLVGYRALWVDFAKGGGTQRYQFNMLQHGPALGLNIRF